MNTYKYQISQKQFISFLKINKVNSGTSILIVDCGKGMQSHVQKNIFEPGYTTKDRGWGLGLSLVKRIVEGHHKGKVSVKSSKLGKGTTFEVVLLNPK